MSTNDNVRKQIIQKAWEDPTFKANLLADPKAAIQEAFGVIIPESIELITLEEKPNKFYLIIPTDPTEVIDKAAQPNAHW